MQPHLQCSGSNISDIKKMVNRIDYWENFTGLCLGLRRHHENLSFFVKIKTRPEVLWKMHRPNFYRSYNKRNCIIECINNLQISLKVQMEKCCMVLQKYWWQILEEKIIDNICKGRTTLSMYSTTAHQYLSYPCNKYIRPVHSSAVLLFSNIYTPSNILHKRKPENNIQSVSRYPGDTAVVRWCGRGKREQYNTFSNRFAFIAPEVQL